MLDIVELGAARVAYFKIIVEDATSEEIEEMYRILEKSRKSVFDPVLEHEKVIPQLKEALRQFEKMRKEKRATITKTQAPAFFKRLLKLSNDRQEVAVEILEQSIANGWQGIFEVKEQNQVREAISSYNFQ